MKRVMCIISCSGDSVQYPKGEMMPLMATWMNIDSTQNANMELAHNNYLLNIVVDDTEGEIDEY